ncbi:Type 1 glutamine amidotransferase-like domain-containing protein [Caballeronia sordidicola]|uniref:Type 1 glutamine amidotransferase-like domain-containing protein n=1 Tax=Caballeronia sordidicola TaxID=196367 RepID=UPI00094D1D90
MHLSIGGETRCGGFLRSAAVDLRQRSKHRPSTSTSISCWESLAPESASFQLPSGDNTGQIDRFHAAYGTLGVETATLSFFNGWGSTVIPYTDYKHRLLRQDAIFVRGGHLRSALAVWREWGLDTTLSEAWNRGVLLAGMSAGGMCWFETCLGGPLEQGNYGLQRRLGLIRDPVRPITATLKIQRGAQIFYRKSVLEGCRAPLLSTIALPFFLRIAKSRRSFLGQLVRPHIVSKRLTIGFLRRGYSLFN